MTILDHLTLLVTDYERSKAFYLAALAPIGCELLMELTPDQVPDIPPPAMAGIGADTPDLWLRQGGTVTPTHLAFHASSKAAVDDFHAAALEAGGKDNGPPGMRPHYHKGYYAAFVIDPDGYNIEVVCHTGE